MAANGISTLPTKQARQIAKLDLASEKRGQSYDIDLLPTKYDGNTLVNNPNVGGLQPHRPWSGGSGPSLTPYPLRTNYAFDFVTPPASGTVWNDDVNQVTLTINGTAARNNSYGRGIVFNGTTTYLAIQDITDGVSALTISMAANFQSANGNWNPVYHGGSYGGSEVFAYIPGAADTDINVGTGDTRSMPAPTLVSGLAWWDFVYTGTSIKVYKNGVKVIDDTIGSPNTGFTSPLLIGARYNGGDVNNGDFLNGTIYRIKGVLSALTPAQVATQYNSIRSTYSLPTLATPASLIFNGTSDYKGVLGTTTDWALGTTWTMEWWSKATGASGPGTIYTVLCQNFNGNGIDIFYQSGNLIVNNGTTLAAEPTPGVWTHVALVNNAGSTTLYYNGTSVHTGGNWNLGNTSDTLVIGKRGPGNFQYFNGKLTGIRITNTAIYKTSNFVFNVDFSFGEIKVTDGADGNIYLVFPNGANTVSNSLIVGSKVTLDFYGHNGSQVTIVGEYDYVPNDPYLAAYPNSRGFRLSNNFGITGQPDYNVGVVNITGFDPYITSLPPANIAGTVLLMNPNSNIGILDLSNSAHTFDTGNTGSGSDYPVATITDTARQWLGSYSGGGNSGFYVLQSDYPNANLIPAGANVTVNGNAVTTGAAFTSTTYSGQPVWYVFFTGSPGNVTAGTTLTFTWTV